MLKPLHTLTCAALATCIAMPLCASSALAQPDKESGQFESAARTLRSELAPALSTFEKLEAQRSAATTDISGARVQGLQDVMYNGLSETPTVTLKLGETTLREGRDFTVRFEGDTINPGTVLVRIEGAGEYTGAIETSFTIVPGDLSHAEVDVIPDQESTPEDAPIEPTPTVSLNGNPLVEGKDYTVAYANNTQKGTATLRITGTGNCIGETHASFEIEEGPLNASEHAALETIALKAGTYAPAILAVAGALVLGAWCIVRARRA